VTGILLWQPVFGRLAGYKDGSASSSCDARDRRRQRGATLAGSASQIGFPLPH
jgi:hypothetical protein